jgi:hypothetical protein
VTSSRELVQWDAIFSRIEPGDIPQFSGNGVMIPRGNLQDLVTIIEEESREAGQSPAEFVRANSHRWYGEACKIAERKIGGLTLVNAEGDPLVFGTATYDVRNESAVIEALQRAPEFEREPQANMPERTSRFAWLEQVQGDSRRSYGSIEIQDGRLRLECNSRRRLEIGRQLVEKYAGEWLAHVNDTFQTLPEGKARIAGAKPGGKKKPESGIPKDVEREMVAQMKAKHYATWSDVSLPALNGKTPREAVRSATGRKAVEDLLRMMENGEERDRKEGKGSFDFSGIRKDLGLAKREGKGK